jgi:hypothetical protein
MWPVFYANMIWLVATQLVSGDNSTLSTVCETNTYTDYALICHANLAKFMKEKVIITATVYLDNFDYFLKL